jgi:hypothetical protein
MALSEGLICILWYFWLCPHVVSNETMWCHNSEEDFIFLFVYACNYTLAGPCDVAVGCHLFLHVNPFNWYLFYTHEYCHVWGIAWRIIMGSGLDVRIYWHFFTITINYDSSQSMSVYDLLHSLLDHEHVLFHCDDQWRISAHTLNSLNDICLTNPPFLSACLQIYVGSFPWKSIVTYVYPCK